MKQAVLIIFAFVCLVIGLSILGEAHAQTICVPLDHYQTICFDVTKSRVAESNSSKSEERCQPVDPSTMIWTGYGFSVAMGDGHVWVNRDDVKYAEVAQPLLCMPSAGMLQLLLPHAWPAYAGNSTLVLAHQKFAADGWIDRSQNKNGQRCCDAGKDCHSLAPERVTPAPGGVNVLMDDGRTLFIPGQEIMPSEDGKHWVCYWGDRVRCFFAPYTGS